MGVVVGGAGPEAFLCSFQKRLLHPGANTADVITQYISSVRGLRILDPRGVVLEQVCEPLRSYLRQEKKEKMKQFFHFYLITGAEMTL